MTSTIPHHANYQMASHGQTPATMATTLTYGDSLCCEVELNDFTFLAANREHHPALGDPAAAVRMALATPVGYPPLASATVPGDYVAIALDEGVPQAATILCGAVAALLDAEVAPAMLTIVSIAAIENRDTLNKRLTDIGAGAVRFEVHDPDNEQAIAMVGVNSNGEPLRMNRTLAEADLVLPIGVGRLPTNEGACAEKFASLFPHFSSRETADRLRSQAASESPKVLKRRAKEIDEAGWLLGVGMTLTVAPGPAGGVAAVFAGDPDAVALAAAEQSRSIWERPVARQGDLVIATVVGDHREQTWENLTRAVAAASAVVEPGGAIAVCSELDEPPSGALNRLLEAVDFGEVQRDLLQEEDVDAKPALVLAQALELGPVYLRSRLPADVVEALGMTPIADDDELARLAAGREHCIVIEEAQHVVPKLLNRIES